MNNAELFVTTNNKSKKKGKYQVFVLNDNTNTFQDVIEALQSFCGHNYYQAGQCATITHHAGKCSVYVDTYEECEDVMRDLLSSDIKCIIEKYKPLTNDKGNTKKTN